MEAAMGGGASFNDDGDWESICGILSIDQDSDFATLFAYNNPPPNHHHQLPTSHDNEVGLFSLLMGDTSYDPITSQFAQFHTRQSLIPNPYINISPLMSSSTTTTSSNDDDLSNYNSSSSGYLKESPFHFVQPNTTYINDDQISPSSSSLDLPINKGSNVRRVTKRARDDQTPLPKKRARVSNKDVGKGKRKTQPRKSKLKQVKVEEDRKSSSDDESEKDESNASDQELEVQGSNGKKRASRGSATDPQSLYARKRRERINERLKILQTLVPNGTKVDISTMLEEAVNYVKFLQLQIKLLSSDEMWMYAPLAYNGFDVGNCSSFWS